MCRGGGSPARVPSGCCPLGTCVSPPPPSHRPFSFWVRLSACRYVDSLPPGEAMPYAWDEPTQRNQIRVQAGALGLGDGVGGVGGQQVGTGVG